MPNLDSRVGRYLGVLAAAALLTGLSLQADAYGGKGVIRFVTNNETGYAGFEFTDPAGNKTQTQEFSIVRGTKCIVDEDQWVNWKQTVGTYPGAPGLVGVKAIRFAPYSSDDSGVGLLNASLGVYDNSKGTSCSRITDALFEGLTLTSKKGAFDRIELDIESKGSAVFRLTIDGNGDKVYWLFTGTNSYRATKSNETPCDKGSDSGPDSNLNDNCPWIIDDVGVSFSIEPIHGYNSNGVNGEGSLEGGGDYVTGLLGGDHSTKIYLTSLVDVGTLGCDSSNNKTAMVYADATSSGAASCQVTRIAPPYAGVSSCDLINYRLETFTAESLCKLDKTGVVDSNSNGKPDEQLAGLLKVTFKPEEKPADWYGLEPTAIQFSPGKDFLAYRCGGTVGPDGNGNPTIKEVLTTGLKGVMVNDQFVARPANIGETEVTLGPTNDALRTNGNLIDWACVLETKDIYQGGEKIQVEQTILFWGDIAFQRP